MSNDTKATTSTVIPTLRYHDAPAAIDWLCDAFGFTRHLVVPGEGGTIAHAQLTVGNGMIMLGSRGASDYDALIAQPDEIDGRETQAPYIIVADPDIHYARAKAAGATIVMEIADQPHGGRFYSCLDPEGRLWNFGSYDPWDNG